MTELTPVIEKPFIKPKMVTFNGEPILSKFVYFVNQIGLEDELIQNGGVLKLLLLNVKWGSGTTRSAIFVRLFVDFVKF